MMKRMIPLLLWLLLPTLPALAASWKVTPVVDAQEVYAGDSFQLQLQITVTGESIPDRPELPKSPDFTCENLESGITRQNINGFRTVIVYYNYQITPKKTGPLIIPSIPLTLKDEEERTQPITVMVRTPQEVDDFKLRHTLSATTAYIGQPITLTTTWYLSKDVGEHNLTLPLLTDPRFSTALLPEKDPTRETHLELLLDQRPVIARRGSGKIGSTDYTTFHFRHILFPRETGELVLPPSSVAFEAVTGYRQSNDPFDSFFRGSRQRAVTRRLVIPSNPLTLTVKALPQEGCPAGFNGLVGSYRISTLAHPTRVSVGDPITLTLTINGPDFLENVRLPRLDRQKDLVTDFRLPQDLPAGEIKEEGIVFTLTLRAMNPGVTRIPPIVLPFFDVESGRYSETKSAAIPLSVTSARIVTARDAEGLSTGPEDHSVEVTNGQEGLAHNYEDLSVLEDSRVGLAAWVHSPGWILAILLPPFLYAAFLLRTLLITRNPEAIRRRKARDELSRLLAQPETRGQDSSAGLLCALKEFIGSILGTPGSAVTGGDAAARLVQTGASDKSAELLRELFSRCEASQYALGIMDKGRWTEICLMTETLLQALEKEIPQR